MPETPGDRDGNRWFAVGAKVAVEPELGGEAGMSD